MVSTSDLINLDYSADLTEAGIAYARRFILTHPNSHTGREVYDSLRNVVADVAVELALRRYLLSHKVPHKYFETTPFTKPGRLEITIGGRRCNIKLSIITNKNQIRELEKDKTLLMSLPATLSKDEVVSNHIQDDDLYIFAFLKALVTTSIRSLKNAIHANQPVFLIYVLPLKWSNPNKWCSLGKIVLKSDSSDPIKLTLEGLDGQRNPQMEEIEINSGIEKASYLEYYTLNSLHLRMKPKGSLSIHSPLLKDTHLVKNIMWRNIWVYGLQIILGGYITRGEYRKKLSENLVGGQELLSGSIQRTKPSIPVSGLHPLPDLFSRAKSWSGN
jgi:hypothetical protein